LTEERVTEYFCQLENAASSRKTPFALGTVHLIARSLSVAFRTAGLEKKVAEEKGGVFLAAHPVLEPLRAGFARPRRGQEGDGAQGPPTGKAEDIGRHARKRREVCEESCRIEEHDQEARGECARRQPPVHGIPPRAHAPHTVHSLVYGHRLDNASEEDLEVTYMPLGAEPDKNSTKRPPEKGTMGQNRNLDAHLWKEIVEVRQYILAHHRGTSRL